MNDPGWSGRPVDDPDGESAAIAQEREDDHRDYWQEFKDDRAMGYIDADGHQIDPEPDWDEGTGR